MEQHKIYYVSPQGSDRNSGLTPQAPLSTLEAASRLALKPGDQLLLQRGALFSRQALHLHVQGSEENPIVIGAYGEGPRPVIEARGSGVWYQDYGMLLDNPCHTRKGYVSSAILLYDCEYIRVQDLEITNDPGAVPGETYSQPDKMNKTGVAVVAQDRGTLHQIILQDLYIHHVMGNVYDKHLNNGGIYCTAMKPHSEATGIARYDKLAIESCRVEHCSRWGIAAGYTYAHAHFLGACLDDETVKTWGHTNVVIRNCFVKDIGGDGITPMYCYKPLVEKNVSDHIATEINDQYYTDPLDRGGKTAAAIWPWKCKDALFQFNEAYNTCANIDGQAWDADSGDGTVYQYNYSYNNAGGCIMFCLQESIHNTFRYNISMLDKGGVINPVQNPDGHIYGNIFVTDAPFVRDGMSGGHMLVENNIICNVAEEPLPGDWHHQTDFASYHGNIYCNFADVPRNDDAARVIPRGEPLLADPLSGPRETDGTVHSPEAFAGFSVLSPWER